MINGKNLYMKKNFIKRIIHEISMYNLNILAVTFDDYDALNTLLVISKNDLP